MLEPRARRAPRYALSALAFAASALAAVALARGEPPRPVARHIPPSVASSVLRSTAARATLTGEAAAALRAGATGPTAGAAVRESLETATGAVVHALPPRGVPPASGAPSFLFLHGMCSIPTRPCGYWDEAGRAGSFLVCPVGNGQCGGLADWQGSGEDKAVHLDAARAALRRRFGEAVRAEGEDVLVGFSRGAFVARDVVYARPGVWRGVVLIGARFQPDAARFLAAGVRRVVLAAGDYDEAAPTMKRAAAQLSAAGLPARFVSLGRIGHLLPRDVGTLMARDLAWVGGAG
jgi:predicted esterase